MINGGLLRDAVISAAHSISNKKKSVDELNVFPVPDGDTGTNMSMTITNSVAELENLSDDTDCSVVASTTASALLRGARGNSGVILSLIFRGFAKGLAGKKEMGANELVESLEQGVSGAYKSVMKPTEGTILTVARESAEKAREMLHSTNDPIIIMEEVCKQAELSLNETPKLLPALAKAGVVDAGGKGLLIIFEAMRDVFKGGEIVKADAPAQKQQVTVDTFAATVGQYDCEIHFTYCTEMIITKKADADDSSKLRAYLETIGDCVVVVEDDEIIKVHVHTNDPGKAIQKGLEFGYINLPKIENMKLQHKARQKEAKQEFVPAKPEKQYGFVAVAAGNGIESMFRDIGVDCIVKGGQTMNPSTEDILAAIMSCPAETVFVLPNNKNIVLAANQANDLTKDKDIIVIPTKTVPQGITAIINYMPEEDVDTNMETMLEEIKNVKTGQVTYAVRDTHIDDKEIHEGDIMGIGDAGILSVGQSVEQTTKEMLSQLVDDDTELISLYYGQDVLEEDAERFAGEIEEIYPDKDVDFHCGGQPIYYYVLSVE